MALVLFFLVVPVFPFFVQPLTSLYSRKHEFEADAYAAVHASPADLVHALVKLYQDNAATLTPDPLHSAFYDSHPPAATRIARTQVGVTKGKLGFMAPEQVMNPQAIESRACLLAMGAPLYRLTVGQAP